MSTRTARDAVAALLAVVALGLGAGCSSGEGEDGDGVSEPGSGSAVAEALARDLSARGTDVAAGELALRWYEGDLPAGVRLFLAFHGEGDERRFVTGLIEDGGQPNTRTNDAVGRLIALWDQQGGADPLAAARAIAFLMAPEDHDIVLEDEQEIAGTPVPPHLEGKVTVPAALEVDGRPGYRFWWVRRSQPSQVTVHLGADGRAVTEQKLGPDFLEEG